MRKHTERPLERRGHHHATPCRDDLIAVPATPDGGSDVGRGANARRVAGFMAPHTCVNDRAMADNGRNTNPIQPRRDDSRDLLSASL